MATWKCTATPCVDSQPQSVRLWMKKWQSEKLLEMHQNQASVFENMLFRRHWSSQLSTVNDASVWIYVIHHHWKSLLFLYDDARRTYKVLYIYHFKQYSLVDPSWGNIPSWVWQGVNHWFRKLWRKVWHHCHFGYIQLTSDAWRSVC